MRMRAAAVVVAVLLLAGAAVPVSRETREAGYRANNHGVALLEQFRPQDAAEAFRQALAKDSELVIARLNLAIAHLNVPDLPAAERESRQALAARPDLLQAHYVLGLALRGQNRGEEAQQAFRAVLAQDPADVGAGVNLGQLLLEERKYPEAVEAFRRALEAEPWNATATYNLGLALTRAGKADEGRQALDRFRVLRDSGQGTLISQTYPEQGRYAEALTSSGAETDLVDDATPAVRFTDATSEMWPRATTPGKAAGPSGRLTLFDEDGDGDLDVFDVGRLGQVMYRQQDGGRFEDVTVRVGLGLEAANAGIGAVAGDLDNDQRADLLVLREAGVSLYRRIEQGFVDVTAAAGLNSAGFVLSAALVDADHDGDLDILLGGVGKPDRLFQNTGAAVFKDAAPAAGLVAPARVLAIVPTDFDNGRDIDLLEIVEGGAPRLFRNLRTGAFKDVAQETGLGAATGLRSVAAADVNKDGYTDFFLGADAGDQLALSDGRGRFTLTPAPLSPKGTRAAQFVDYDNDGLLDLVAFSGNGTRLLRNLGGRWTDVSEAALGAAARVVASSAVAGDLDADGDMDLLVRLSSGELRYWRNAGDSGNRSLAVRLSGLVSNRSGVGTKVEMRAGSLRQKLETYAATPAPAPASVLFGLGKRASADAVRVIWPAGILQTEIQEAAAAAPARTSVLRVEELNRKPSSCPYLYAWNGQRFEFITDFMGGGEMGYNEGPGHFNHPDPVEYTRLTDEQLVARDGRLELRVTNELEEALFVDRLALLAITHPADVELFPYEGMTVPPKPFRLYAVKGARPPRAAHDERGRDVLGALERSDRRFVEGFGLHRIRGYAERHELVLDLGAVPESAALLLTGWTDYAFSSDNVAAHQAGLAVQPPALEVEDAAGKWVTAIEQIGIPVGRPQTVVADLSGVWKGKSRRVRIVTNMRIYWDEIRVGEVVDAPSMEAPLVARTAELRERGYSKETSPDGREPYGYDYAQVSEASPWKIFPGRFTREGDVRELLLETDDTFVVSRTGDEVTLAFDAPAAPPPGSRRTYLLHSDGFSKEMDIRSATPDTLGPFPFHGMTRYPYTAPEAFPLTEERRKIMESYNTRVVKAAVPLLELAAAQH
jgi:tetratricopeptide (TPR) repeat protein